ncbi:unnamed protein product [Mycena citricolor]|uniref:Helitron helicase-like domain-containing protein n=1 Tax=Mycena citricolor TaxID=2018698 RepID=A0AAD2H8W0_9AGAR|nr:unnamed protein product [Mycena citricolor]
MERGIRRRAQAEALGLRYCYHGAHQVTTDACTEGGRVYASCNECRARAREKAQETAARQSRHRPDVDDGEGAIGDDRDEGIQVLDEFDQFFGDGSDMNIDLPEDAALDSKAESAVREFREALDGIKLQYCPCCREEGFDIHLTAQEICARCTADTNEVKRWSDANNCNPMPSSRVPPCLQNLTDMEEMLIARTKTIMQVRWTKGRQLSYKDHIINFPQNIENVAAKLPRLPEDIDIVIIRREGVDLSQHVDYVVRRDKVRDALEYKIAHDPDYANLGAPDEATLSQLPLNGSVVNRLSVCREGRQDGQAAMPAGPVQAAAVSGDNDEEGESATTVGGVLNLGNPVREEVTEIRDGANRAISGLRYEQTVITAPTVDANPISEYTPGYMTRAFPTLFPNGTGDFFAPRQRKIELGEYFKHLLRFEGGRFARHQRFPWFAFNTLQRHRVKSQAKIFVKQNHDAGRMTSEELKALLEEGDQSIARKMIRYGTKLRGTRAFWHSRRNELTDMIRVKGSPHLFFTLSAADLQWPDLHHHMPKETDAPAGNPAAE